MNTNQAQIQSENHWVLCGGCVQSNLVLLAIFYNHRCTVPAQIKWFIFIESELEMRMLVHKCSRIDRADHKCFLMVTNFHIHDAGCFEFLHIYFLKVLNNVYTKFSVILVA